MTKSDFITRIAGHFPQLRQVDAQIAVDLILDAIAESLAEGRRAEIRGFGSFNIHYRPAKLGRNPKNGEPVPVPEKYAPHFKPGKTLAEAVQVATTPAGPRMAA